jgi:hypothetical protein
MSRVGSYRAVSAGYESFQQHSVAEKQCASLERDEFWRWVVLISFCLNAGYNFFAWADFESASVQAEILFDIDSGKLAWHYSIAFFASVPPALPVAYWLKYDLPSSHLFLALSNTLVAWLRYWATVKKDYALCLASAVVLGVGLAIATSSFTPLFLR